MHPSRAKYQRPGWRVQSLVSLVVCVWIALAVRLVHLQWSDQADLANRASRQRTFIETIPARPGEIIDRHGRLLATTVTAKSLFVVPSQIPNAWPIAMALGETLRIDADKLFERIARHRNKHFLWIKRRLTDDEISQLRTLDLPDKVWGFREEFLRRYPQGKLAAHVLGTRDIDGKGRGGLEQSLDSRLGGHPGHRRLVRDARGRVIDVIETIDDAPQRGESIRLTLDSIIQLHAERELDRLMDKWKPRGVSAVVMVPQTGEVLAMASRPTFDPNELQSVPAEAWKNQAVSAIYEPGSTFKPFVVAWAIDHARVEPDETFHCENGLYRMGRRRLRDHHPYGRLNVVDILVKSSNIGMAKIGERLTNKGLYDAALAFGFGSKTGIELPGELTGILRPLQKWDSYSTGSIPMGQEIAATPLQLITAHAALANRGRLISPHLVLNTSAEPSRLLETDSTKQTGSNVVSQTVRAEVARWIVEGPLTGVVRRGTGKRAMLRDYTVFGKTGTSQKLDPATGRYSTQRYVSSFVCGAPAANPQVLVLVIVDEPSVGKSHYGGVVAAPAAARLLRKALICLRVPTEKLRSARR